MIYNPFLSFFLPKHHTPFISSKNYIIFKISHKFLRTSSVFSHFLMNFPGSTSSVLHCDFTTFLVEHRSPDLLALGFGKSLTSLVDELIWSGSSSFHIHPILFVFLNSSFSFAQTHNPHNSVLVFSIYIHSHRWEITLGPSLRSINLAQPNNKFGKDTFSFGHEHG